jgi:hypothetical protein
MIKHRKKEKINWCIFWTSLFLGLCVFLLIKFFVVYTIYQNLFPIKYCIGYFRSDIYFFTIFSFFLTIIFCIKKNIIRIICNILLLYLSLLYYIDIFVMKFFLTRESMFSIVKIIGYWWVWWNSLTKFAILRIIVYVTILWVSYIFMKYKDFYKKFWSIFSTKWFLVIYLICIIIKLSQVYFIKPAFPNVENIVSINLNSIQYMYKNNLFNAENYENYLQYQSWDWNRSNIIIIFWESFSAIDSKLNWWNDNMPYFDKMQKNWISFVNFFANGIYSINSHIAVFQWISTLWWDYYLLPYDALPKFLNNIWYKTIHISTSSLDFLDERKQLKDCWFQKIIWEEEFLDRPHYVRDAASDEDLYNRALTEIIVKTWWNFFISMATESFHTPYDCPYWDTQSLCLKYADEKLYDFYKNLQNIWFFESGILIIIWDHRKREPIESGEYNIFGSAWEYKSVATIIWNWIASWVLNENLIQPMDFYYSIKKYLSSWEVKLDKFYNDVFSNTKWRDWWITSEWKLIYHIWDKYNLSNFNQENRRYNEAYNYFLSLKKLWLYHQKGLVNN